MKVLITNDDGVNSYGLTVLAKFAKRFGEVICVAPMKEQSGKSQCIIIKEPFSIMQYDDILPGVKTYGIDSTPADCVRVANYYLKKDFDIVLSGINNGYNLGEDILYSGTIGAASEAVLCGKKAIAFSVSRDCFQNIDEQMDEIIKYIENNKLLDIHNLWNINICEKPEGIRYTNQGYTNFDAYYQEVNGGMLLSKGQPDFAREKDRSGSDVNAIYNNYISITPLNVDRTNYVILNKVNKK